MSERDELPEGWEIIVGLGFSRNRKYRAQRRRPFRITGSCGSRERAIAAAWRIVDAEKEAADGR